MIYIILLFFILGLYHNNFINLINKFISIHLKNNFSLLKYNFLSYIFSFKYLIYLYLIYILYNLFNLYIQFDETNNIDIFSFYELVNLSTNEYNVFINNTTYIYSVYKIIENVPRAIATYGAYKAGRSIYKKSGIITALVAGMAAGAVLFGTILDANLAMFKNKLLFTMITVIPNQNHVNIFPYNLLSDMYLMNTCCIGLLIVIFNIILVEYIQPINLLKYLPSIIKHSRIYFLIEFFFNRYINIWNKSKKPILIVSIICIIINFSFIQLGLYLLINHNPY